MVIRHVFAAVLVMTLLAPALRAQNHLLPEPGQLTQKDWRQEIVQTLFSPIGYQRNVLIRAVVLDGFGGARLTGIRATDVGYEAFHLAPDSTGSELLRSLDGGSDEPISEVLARITVREGAVMLDSTVAEAVIEIWRRMLLRTAHNEDELLYLGFGHTVHYSAHGQGWRPLAGFADTPSEGTLPYMLGQVRRALQSYVYWQVPSRLQRLNESVSALREAIAEHDDVCDC